MSRGLIVVGGGPVGAFAALTAALKGERVTLVDPRGVLGGAASRSAGVVTVQLEDPLDVRLVVRSIELIRSVSKSSSVRTGFLQIGREEDLSDSMEAMREAGVEHEVLTAEEIRERWPVFRVDGNLIGIYTDVDLSVEPPLLGGELSGALASLGVEVIRQSVVSFSTDGGRIEGVVLEDGERLKHDGLILAAGRDHPLCLGPNVVVTLADSLSDGQDTLLDVPWLASAFAQRKMLARGGMAVELVRHSDRSATLYIPGKAPLLLTGAKQIAIFEVLVKAYHKGSPIVKTSELMAASESFSSSSAFSKAQWATIKGVYLDLAPGVKRGAWMLLI